MTRPGLVSGSIPTSPKKLGRQSLLLEGALFEIREVCRRIAAEAGAQDPGVVALFQAGSGLAPLDQIDRREILGADWGEAGQRGGADGAAHDQAWRDWGGGAPISLRPVVRRSWWRWAPKTCSRSLLVGGRPGTRR